MTTSTVPSRRSGRRERTSAEAVFEAEEQDAALGHASVDEARSDGDGGYDDLSMQGETQGETLDQKESDVVAAVNEIAGVFSIGDGEGQLTASSPKQKAHIWLLLDLFRFDEGPDGPGWVHETNVATFTALLGAVFGGIDGLKVDVLDHAALNLEVDALMHGDRHATWLSTFQGDLRPEVADRLKDLVQGSFVVLIEPSPALRRAVEAAAGGVLELAVHPARLLPELLLLASSTVPAIRHALATSRVTDYEIAWRYRCWKARRLKWARTNQIGSGWPAFGVLLGQMPHDSAMIRNGRFVDPADFEESIRAAAVRDGLLLVKPHPYAPLSDRTIAMLESIPNVVFTDANFYSLACDPRCRSVYAVSSSGLQEAQWFGADATPLAAPADHLMQGPVEAVTPWALAETIAPAIAAHLGLALRSPASRFVLAPEPILRPLIQETWGRAEPEDAQGLPALRKLPRTRMQASVAFDHGCLAYGWFPVEDWGVWSNGSSAALTIPWSFGNQMQVILELVAAETSEEDPAVVEIFCDGRILTSASLAPIGTDPSIVICDVPRPTNGSVISLLLRVSRVAQPRPGLDQRELGLGLVSLQLSQPYGKAR